MGISQDEYERLKQIIKEYAAALEECAEYFDQRSDISNDHDEDGSPRPNKEMLMLQMIEGVL